MKTVEFLSKEYFQLSVIEIPVRSTKLAGSEADWIEKTRILCYANQKEKVSLELL